MKLYNFIIKKHKKDKIVLKINVLLNPDKTFRKNYVERFHGVARNVWHLLRYGMIRDKKQNPPSDVDGGFFISKIRRLFTQFECHKSEGTCVNSCSGCK